MPLPAPTGFKITVKHHPKKAAPVGHGLLHLCHARREHETIRDAGIAAEPLPFTGISERLERREGEECVLGGWGLQLQLHKRERNTNQEVVHCSESENDDER